MANVDINQFLNPEYQGANVPTPPSPDSTATETPPLSPDGCFSYYDVLSEDATGFESMMDTFTPMDTDLDFTSGSEDTFNFTSTQIPPQNPQGIPLVQGVPVVTARAASIQKPAAPVQAQVPRATPPAPKPTKTVIRTKRRANKRKRKASQISLPEPSENNSVILSRQALLALKSNEFDAYISKVQEKRELTGDEQRELKRQRRLIKNRESAQQSRQRRKDYIEQLEEKVAQLASENQSIKTELYGVRERNGQLQQEVAYLQSMIKKNRGLNAVYSGINLLRGPAKENLTSGNIKAASVCLLLVLFSFGLFWNNGHMSYHVHRDTVPQVLPAANGGRHLLEIDSKPAGVLKKTGLTELVDVADSEETERRMKVIRERVHSKPATPDKQTKEFDDMELDTVETKSEIKIEQPIKLERDSISMKIVDHDAARPSKKRRVADASPVQVVSSSNTVQPQIQHWKPNTTYLMCADVQQITPPPSVEVNDSAPFMVAFLIPPDSFGSPTPSSQSERESLLEVTCQVVDVAVVPSPNGRTNRREESAATGSGNAVQKIS